MSLCCIAGRRDMGCDAGIVRVFIRYARYLQYTKSTRQLLHSFHLPSSVSHQKGVSVPWIQVRQCQTKSGRNTSSRDSRGSVFWERHESKANDHVVGCSLRSHLIWEGLAVICDSWFLFPLSDLSALTPSQVLVCFYKLPRY